MTKNELAKKLRNNFKNSNGGYHKYNYIIWKISKEWNYLDICHNIKNIDEVLADYPSIPKDNYFFIQSKYFRFDNLKIINEQLSFINSELKTNLVKNKNAKIEAQIIRYLDMSNPLNGIKDGFITDNCSIFKINSELKIRKMHENYKLYKINLSEIINMESDIVKNISLSEFTIKHYKTYKTSKIYSVDIDNKSIYFQKQYIDMVSTLYDVDNINICITKFNNNNNYNITIIEKNTNIRLAVIMPIVINNKKLISH